MFCIKGMQGFMFYLGKVYIEIKVKIYNCMFFFQIFLWWVNFVVVVNDYYYLVFLFDVNVVFDYGKCDVFFFFIVIGVYYKQDYFVGVDIFKYKNILVFILYMVIKFKYDFVGGYEEDVCGGFLYVVDYYVFLGKK